MPIFWNILLFALSVPVVMIGAILTMRFIGMQVVSRPEVYSGTRG